MKYFLLLLLILGSLSYAQYTAEWTSPNLGPYGWGGSYGYDVDNDGLVEFEIKTGSQYTFYNGNYTSAWTISFPGYDYLYLLRPRDIDGDGRIVPLNTDNDGAGELVIAGYYLSGSIYYGRFRVYDASSHTMEYESPLITGFYGIGSLEDIDGDGRDEIIITKFGSTTSESYVVVYAYTAAIEGQVGTYEVRSSFKTFPNPTNKGVIIPFSINQEEMNYPIKVSIYDDAGRQIKILMKNIRAAQGDYRLIWDGTDEQDIAVPSGSYFVHIVRGNKEYKNAIKFIR